MIVSFRRTLPALVNLIAFPMRLIKICPSLVWSPSIKFGKFEGQSIVNLIPRSLLLIANNFSLSQNYPNPFNPVTNIKFEIPVGNGRDRSVKLIVYDLLGKEITTLVNQQMQAGSYSVDWDASNYPSGVYFYKLESENFTESKKMVLIK